MNTWTLKRWLLLAASMLVLEVASNGQQQEPAPHKRPEIGDELPDFRGIDAATGATVSMHAALAATDAEGPLVVAFVHRDKDLCVRFVEELRKQVEGLGVDAPRCAIHMVFSGEEREGAVVTAARALPAPFRTLWDADRAAYQAVGLIAFPTVYVVDRKSRRIDLLRRGYTITLAREVTDKLKVGLGLMTAEDLARAGTQSAVAPTAVQQRVARAQQARQLLRSGKAEQALEQFEGLLSEMPHDPAAMAGRAIAMAKLDRPEAHDLLVAAHEELPDDRAVALALGESLLRSGRLDAAEPLIRQALEHDPAAWFALGNLHERRGNWREAALAYREAATRLMR